jgi:putative tryptophan/tyrosine transport system substrate-binding protein
MAVAVLGAGLGLVLAAPDAAGRVEALVRRQRGRGGLLVAEDAYYSSSRDRVVGLAARHRLPTIYTLRDFVTGGGLMSYGVSVVEAHRRGAAYADKILKGATPADLPVERPTTFDFVINLRTARALRLTIPPSVLQQATAIIQ